MCAAAGVLWVLAGFIVLVSGLQSILLARADPGTISGEPMYTIAIFGPVAGLMALVGLALWTSDAAPSAGEPRVPRRRLRSAAPWVWGAAVVAATAHWVFLVEFAGLLALLLGLAGLALWLLARGASAPGGTAPRPR